MSILGRRVPSGIRTIKGGKSAEFYTGGSVVLDAFVVSNAHATDTVMIEFADRRRHQESRAFYISAPPEGSVTFETPTFWPNGFVVRTGASAKVSVVFTDGGSE